MRPLLEPPPRPLSNVTLVGLVAAVVLATGMLVLRYVQGARPGRAEPAPATWSAPESPLTPTTVRRGSGGSERTPPASYAPPELRERPSAPSQAAAEVARPSLWCPDRAGS